MSLKAIVARLGGELYDGGRRANIPGPGHSRCDRSVSLLQDGDQILIHSFGGSDWREVRDHLSGLGLLRGAANAPTTARRLVQQAASAHDRTRQAAVRSIWAAGRALPGTLSERHFRLRRIEGALPGAQAIRHGPATPISGYLEGGPVSPALLAAIRDPGGDIVGLEITYLAPNGRRAHRLQLSRKIIGRVPPGSAIRLAVPGPRMLVAEGVFSALSASCRFHLPAWALTSAGNLSHWRPPPYVRTVLIAADRGLAGERAASQLRDRLAAAGLSVQIALPPAPFGDWNEAAGGLAGFG